MFLLLGHSSNQLACPLSSAAATLPFVFLRGRTTFTGSTEHLFSFSRCRAGRPTACKITAGQSSSAFFLTCCTTLHDSPWASTFHFFETFPASIVAASCTEHPSAAKKALKCKECLEIRKSKDAHPGAACFHFSALYICSFAVRLERKHGPISRPGSCSSHCSEDGVWGVK